MEYSGPGVASIQTYLQELVERIATLGSKIISPKDGSNLSAEAITITSSGQNSVLTSIIIGVSEVLTKSLKTMVKWDSEKDLTDKQLEDVFCNVNTDFNPSILSANHINAVSLLNNKLLLSDKETFEILKKGELIPNSKDYKEHQKEIKESKFYDLLFGDLVNESQSNIPTKDQVQDSVNNTDVAPERYLSTDNPFDPNAKKKGTTPDSGNPD